MKKLLLYILLFHSQLAMAQVPVDSLKNICKHLFKAQIDSSRVWESSRDKGKWRLSVEELFPGHFDSANVFMLLWSFNPWSVDPGGRSHDTLYIVNHAPGGAQLFVLDPATGKELVIHDNKGFNKLLSENHPLCNLDKCYLYIFLTDKTMERLTDARDYRKALRSCSAFYKESLPTKLYHQFGIVRSKQELGYLLRVQPQMDEDIARSTKTNMYMYTMSEKAIYRYQFFFDREGEIEKVVRALVP